MRRTAALLAALLLTPLVSCAPTADDDPGSGVGPVDVDVDTPALRKLKHQAGVEDCAPGPGTPVDDGLPDFTLACLGGGPDVNLGSLRGPLVVNFWSVTCPPCRREMPIYQQYFEKYAGRVGVLGIDYDDVQPQAALELVRDTGVTYPLLTDPGTGLATTNLRIPGLPAIAFVDADGRLTRLMFKEIRSVSELEDLVEEHLGVAP